MAGLNVEAERFRNWAKVSPENQRSGEWETEYEAWPELYAALFAFLDSNPSHKWSSNETKDVLFVLARDNENQYVVREVGQKYPEIIMSLAQASIEMGERDCRWQLAEEIGRLNNVGRTEEQMLLTFIENDDEYVRRRALQSLARIASPETERLAIAEWNRPDRDQEWARMNVLWCLYKSGSPILESLLVEAELDERNYLSTYARRVRNNDVTE